MDQVYSSAWYGSFSLILTQTLAQITMFVPRIVAAILVLIIGSAIAKAIKRVVVKLLETMRLSNLLKNTPVEHFLTNAELGHKLEEVIGSIVYWLSMLIVLHTSVNILGLEPLSAVLAKVVNYLPNVVSAILVLFFGTLLAGVVESLVKGSIKSIDGRSSRILGKVSSYLVVSIAVLAAISELGIASEFIMILFVGFVTMISLGIGLALGLGGQDVVRKMLNTWYDKTLKEVSE
jgi:hypothetical protein